MQTIGASVVCSMAFVVLLLQHAATAAAAGLT